MRKLVSEEMSKQSNTRHSSPSIVARLMGMDPLPSDTKSVVQPVTKKSDNRRVELSGREKNVKGCKLSYLKQTKVDSINSTKDRDAERWNTDLKFEKPRRREHPQEEELQRFKKEFEAWQVARLRECTKVFDVGSISTNQFTQEKPNKERNTLYADSLQAMHGKPLESKRFAVQEKGLHLHLHHQRYKSELFTAQQNESRRRSINRDFRVPSTMDYKEKLDAAPTRIVILKPGPDGIYEHEESWTSSPSAFQERSNMEEFLEEVRERLKSELQGKALNRNKNSVVRGSGIETPFSEKPSSDPRQIAKHIANQARENDYRDIRMNLVRSEPIRSYRGDITFNKPVYAEFIDKNTRRFLSERLRNVLKEETQFDVPIVSACSFRSSEFDNGRERIKKMQDKSKPGNEQSDWEIVKQEMQTRSFRLGEDAGPLNGELSPRNLIRSLSAPVSGTSFGKLLLEDRHIVTGAQIRTKHEGIETASVDIRRKKEKFNLKEKVSNIKYGLTFRRRLFGKKIHSMVESYGADNDLARDILSGPTVIMNFGKNNENSTEVPPSPASVCSSSPHEEFWRVVDYLSPISTPDATVRDDNAVPHAFREISSNLNGELTRQPNELESDEANRITIEQELTESETVNLEDHAHGYVRDLLIASGLYDGLCDKSLSRWDPLSKPISKSVFEQVEEYHRKSAKENDKKVDHKVLLDLLNEALSTILGPQVTMSRIRRKVLGSTISTPPEGRKLLNSVWEIVHINLHPPTDRYSYSLETMVARDLGSTPWTGMVDEETNGLGSEVEWHIIGDLVEEVVKDICIHEGWHL